ncbi:unnamed protein product [Echinostoma caproni]|uniref:RIIa domain-containing protein n=1 Tax=Echinostoma caproni TaxID=27848 RepID=A0A183A718_9TREM|nr:unnamed protein product [Echinostoma caproni]
MDTADTGSAQPKHDPPIAMEPYDLGKAEDLGALSNEQQWHTNNLKTQTRINNERYMRNHPEIHHMISAFLSELNSDFFTHPDLLKRVEDMKEEYMKQHREDMVVRGLAGEDIFGDDDDDDTEEGGDA